LLFALLLATLEMPVRLWDRLMMNIHGSPVNDASFAFAYGGAGRAAQSRIASLGALTPYA